MINIRKGQYFQSQNKDKYIFLSYKNPNIIYCVNEDFENTGEILLFDVDFIETPLEEYNDKVKKINWYYQCEEELENSNLEDKLDTLITNISNDFKNWEKEVSFLKLDIRIKNISDLVKGKAYYGDQNQYYEVIGFFVETETYEKGKNTESNIGFFSIYHSKCDNLAPMTFFYNDKNNKDRYFNKGTNDYVIIDEILLNKEDINKYINEHNYSISKIMNEKEKGMGI